MIWTRRRFLKASAAGLAAGILLPNPRIRAQRLQGFQEIRRGVGTFEGEGGTIGWLVNDGGAVVVDSQFPDSAADCVTGLEERGGLPIDALINSHHHGDHTAGNGVFRDVSGMIVAHRRVPELQREAARADGSEEDQTYPDTTFDDSWSLEVGDEVVRASYYGPAHTSGDATIHFQEADVVHMGDLVFNRLYPFIDRAAGASVQGWIELLEAVVDDHSSETVYIFGHGQPGFGLTGGPDDLRHQRDFFTALLEEAEAGVSAGRSREEVAAADELPGFPDHVGPSDFLSLGRALEAAYDEVSEGNR